MSEQIWPWPAEGRAWGLHRVGAGQMESERSGAALPRSQVTTKARARSRAAKPAHRGSERSPLLFWTCAEEELDLTSKVQSAWQSTEDKVREAPFHNLLRNFVPPSWRSLPSFSLLRYSLPSSLSRSMLSSASGPSPVLSRCASSSHCITQRMQRAIPSRCFVSLRSCRQLTPGRHLLA